MTSKYVVRLSAEERNFLFEIIDAGKGGKERLNRARILLKADIGENGENWKDSDISEAFYVDRRTVERTRKSLVEEGLEATINRQLPKVKKPGIIGGKEEAHLIALVCGAPPEGHCAWSLRLLADRMVELNYMEKVSHETIRLALKKTNLSLGKKRNGAFRQNPARASFVKWRRSSTSTKNPTTLNVR
jgi:hypothetical protein